MPRQPLGNRNRGGYTPPTSPYAGFVAAQLQNYLNQNVMQQARDRVSLALQGWRYNNRSGSRGGRGGFGGGGGGAGLLEARRQADEDQRLAALRLQNLVQDIGAGKILSQQARDIANKEYGTALRGLTSDVTSMGAITSKGFEDTRGDLQFQLSTGLKKIDLAEQERKRREAEEWLRAVHGKAQAERARQAFLAGGGTAMFGSGGGGGGYGGGGGGGGPSPAAQRFLRSLAASRQQQYRGPAFFAPKRKEIQLPGGRRFR